MLIKYLSNGMSGAHLELHKKNEVFYIRKKAYKSHQISVLIDQSKILQSWQGELIQMPFIIANGFSSANEYFVDMEYIHGDTFCHFLANPNILNSRQQEIVFSLLVDYMNNLLSSSTPNDNSMCIFSTLANKIQGLSNIISQRNKNDSIIRNLLNKVYIESLIKKEEILNINRYAGFNQVHGDLTLSNIIVTKSKFIFIDPIYHYLNPCILSDYFKLIFDLDFLLSFKIESTFYKIETSILLFITRLKLQIRNIYLPNIHGLAIIEDLFLCIEAFRVLQYTDITSSLGKSLVCYIENKLRLVK